MRTRKLLKSSLLAAAVFCSAGCWTYAQDYKPVQGRIMTRWAGKVDPQNVLPEYPRPQMVRKDWQNLNGLWEYAIVSKDSNQPQQFDGKILVPFAVEAALSGVGKTVGPANKLWYRRQFQTPAAWTDKRVLLHFGAVDWECQVWVNGKSVGNHSGGYDAFGFDITDALKKTGTQEIVVSVWDPTEEGTQPRGKQISNPNGIWYTSVTGIWQTVWIEPAAKTYISSLKITPDTDNQQVAITVETVGDTQGLSFSAKSENVMTTSIGNTLTLKIEKPILWSPATPHLYDLTVQLINKNNVLDEVESYFGMRKIALGRDKNGITRIMLNNEFVFQYGFLDQGWWPDGLYTAPTEEAMLYDLQITKELGFNMLRKHVKVEPARLYYWCDKLGLLVWQDMPSGDRYIGGNDPDIQRTAQSTAQFELELKRMIDGLYNHPSIVMWVPFNEGWGQFDTARITDMVKKLDPTRLVNNASGWADRNVGDVHDMHKYPAPGMPPVEEKRAVVLGEFGGLGLPLAGHTWQNEKNWGYKSYENQDKLTDAYLDLAGKLLPLISQGLSAAVYTQTTDVEVEVNGFLTYDREILKLDKVKVQEAHKKLYEPLPAVKTLVSDSQTRPRRWRYTLQQPADGWENRNFDDKQWLTGPGGFGTAETPGAAARTEWKGNDIWLRREFRLEKLPQGQINLVVHHDDQAKVYINGVLAADLPGWTTGYEIVPVEPAAAKALAEGINTMAIHCHQDKGDQYIDAGLVEMIPPKDQ